MNFLYKESKSKKIFFFFFFFFFFLFLFFGGGGWGGGGWGLEQANLFTKNPNLEFFLRGGGRGCWEGG